MKNLFIFLISLTSIHAQADYFITLVGYGCNKANDSIVVNYFGAYNEAGDELAKNATENQWELWSLVETNDDGIIGNIKKIEKDCKLSDGDYKVKIQPEPGNMNVNGRCGAQISASFEITKDGITVYRLGGFEGDCHASYGQPVTTSVTYGPNLERPKIEKTPYDDFYK